MNREHQINFWYVIAALIAIVLIRDYMMARTDVVEIPYSEFQRLLADGKVNDLTVGRATVAGRYAEQAKVAVRNVRRDGMDLLKRLEKASDISQDDHKLYADEIQEMTDKMVARIDEMLATKEKEIMQV